MGNFDMSLNETNSDRSYYIEVLFIAVGSHLINNLKDYTVFILSLVFVA